MFVLEVVTLLTTVILIRDVVIGSLNIGFELQIILWLWFTVLFANFAEAVAEGRGKAQADTLRRTRTETQAKLLTRADATTYRNVPAPKLKVGDVVLVEAGDIIPSDGEVIQGIASVNEAAITGESAPVIRESGGDRSAVTGGTVVLSDWIKVRITAAQGTTFLDRMIKLVEGAERQKTPNEIALNILLVGLTIIFVFATATIPSYVIYAQGTVSIVILVALFITLIPTTIGALLSAIGIAGMDRLVRFNVLAMSGRAVEAAGDVDTLLLDKTGTITLGNRQATQFIPVHGISEQELADAAQLASLADETPEGRSVVVLAKEKYNIRGRDLAELRAKFIPFTAQSRMSGGEVGGSWVRKGAVEAILDYLNTPVSSLAVGGGVAAAWRSMVPTPVAREVTNIADEIAKSGGTPLAVAKDGKLLGVIQLKDIVKGGIRERFAELRRMGIRTIMITGDNPTTAAAIAAEAGVDDFLAQATPEQKLKLIRDEQSKGKLVAMCGDGTNDAPALAQADVGVAMNTGTQAAREAGNMVDLDSNPTKLIEIVEIGKQLLMTRGALTTFSIANDVAKYFAIIPAMFLAFYPQLQALNVMSLATPQSAILSAIIFNAIIIIALIPLSLKGVRYRPIGAAPLLRRNLLIYGLGGIVIPFIGIKSSMLWSRHFISFEAHSHDARTSSHNRPPFSDDANHRHRLSVCPDRDCASRLPVSGTRQPYRAERPGRRIRADRAVILRRPLFPRPALRYGRSRSKRRQQDGAFSLQRSKFRWLKSGPHQQGSDGARAS
jgi:K+-transporting ATPase ATPase B chain